MKKNVVLDLGCGNKKTYGAITVDVSEKYNPDIVHNLNVFPYPFDNDSIDMIYMDNVLEHLDDTFAVLKEINRILKPDGMVKIIVPYFRSPWAFIDPTHKKFFTTQSMIYVDRSNPISRQYDYVDFDFKILNIIFNEGLNCNMFRRAIAKFANRYPVFYECHLSTLFPLDQITYLLVK